MKWNAQTLLGLVALALAGLAPNLFPAAQAGMAKLSFLAKAFLLPSMILLAAIYAIARARGLSMLTNRLAAGAAAGLLATVGLEIVRIISFHLGGMPGDMPRLMGVLLTDRFMDGPSGLSDLLGWGYHFWNGAAFGIVFTLVFGLKPMRWNLAYGLLIGFGFLASPVVKSLGVGAFGLEMPAMPITVLLAHVAFGLLLGIFSRRWLRPGGGLLAGFREAGR